MSSLTDYPDWAPHVATAAQIANTGVPLLTKPALLLNDNGRAMLAGANFTYPSQAVNQPGYSIKVAVQFPAAATVPFCKVRLTWTDTVTAVEMATETFIVTGNTAGGGWWTFGHGRAKADTLNITVYNLDGAQTATVSVIAVQDSMPRTADDWRGVNAVNAGTTVPAWTLPTLPDDESVLGIGNDTIPASGGITRLLGLYSGVIGIGLNVVSGSISTLTFNLQAEPTSVYAGNNPIIGGAPPGLAFTVAGPRAPMRLVINNSATTAVNLAWSAIALPKG